MTGQQSGGNVKPVPYLSVTPQAAERGVVVRYVGRAGQFALHYGDGINALADGNRNYGHIFPQAGVYTVTAREIGSADLLTATAVVVRVGGAADCVTWGPAPDNPEIWQARFVEVEPRVVPPHLDIDWGDGTVDRVWALPDTVLEHPLPAGEHAVTVTDLQTRRRQATTQTVTLPTYDPDFTIAEVSGATPRRKARITLTAVTAGKPLLIGWGEPFVDPVRVAAAKPGAHYDYTYPTDGDKFPSVAYEDGSGAPNDQGFVQIPFTGAAG